MWGIMLKDLYTIKRQGKMLIFLFLIYIFIAYFGEQPMMMTGIVAVVALMMPITCMAYEERCKWGVYAQALPVSKATQVGEKYIFPMLLCLIGSTLTIPIAYLVARYKNMDMTLMEIMLSTLGVMVVGLFFLAFILPMMYRFGVEKGRLGLFVFAAAIGLGSMAIGNLGKNQTEDMPSALANAIVFVEKNTPIVVATVVVVCIMLYVISYFVSLSIEKKKEY